MKVSEYSRQYVEGPGQGQGRHHRCLAHPDGLGRRHVGRLHDRLGGGPDRRSASWETDVTTHPDAYYLRCLVGPVSLLLIADTYKVLVGSSTTPRSRSWTPACWSWSSDVN